MTQGGEVGKNELITQLLAAVDARWSDGPVEDVRRFMVRYYQGVAAEDLLSRPLDDLYGAAISHWRLLHQDAPTPRIHVYNPDPEQQGWQSTHSIVQIVTEDMPFLVDSVSMALTRHGHTIHLVIHPVLPIRRQGNRLEVAEQDRGEHAAVMHFEIDRQPEPERLAELARELAAVLEDVRLAVSDWPAMRGRLREVIEELRAATPAGEERDEVLAFLEWLEDDHFTFLGYRCYELVRQDEDDDLVLVPESGLGILHKEVERHASESFAALPPQVRRLARRPDMLIVTKSNSRATVHRPGYMDYVGIKRLDAQGVVVGEHRFLGLYTSAAYNRSPRDIPLLRRKVDWVLSQAGLPPRSHAGKALAHILETYPRDELFQIEPELLHQISLGILHLQERQRTRLFVRYDTYRRYVSCLVFAPRERYNTEVRQRMQAILQQAFGGVGTEFSVQLSESVLARIHFIVRLAEPGTPEYDHAALEALLAQAMRSWLDDYHAGLLEHLGEARGNQLFTRYRDAFTGGYREDNAPRTAAQDSERLERLDADNPLSISLYRPLEAPEGALRLKFYHWGPAISLSAILPMLENMGVSVLDERPYAISPGGVQDRWIHDFGLHYDSATELDTERVRGLFQETLAATWHGLAEDDGFNRLALGACLSWREIVVLRAYAKWLRQSGTTLSQAYVESTLTRYPHIVRLLLDLFMARFDPDRHDPAQAEALAGRIEQALDAVPSLDEDRILRRYLAAIQATLRTNFFQTGADGGPKPYLSLKLTPALVPDVPAPHPRFEVFVYAPTFEGVHLRGGEVARGGIRWSDRREDFRTEVLGLIKAQMVKNAVIVPVGAKGGFCPKRLPAGSDRDALMNEVRRCYADFIRGLLDLTDNRLEQGVVAPPRLVRHDGDDPYLVVAADKGTASFSDLANAVAAEYDFWLKDAFASGGSSGYDHKKMGITARGGWEAVKRHFRELGVDVQRQPFTAVGIGDMSGDVFGNGMLLSEQTRLVAAFDHRHIFLDPDPDPAASYQERRRLFQLPRSSWGDYDPSLISAGGGVYPRSAKSITLSPEAQRALGTDRGSCSPLELIRLVLQAPVDLLWNGGIGTYVKASTESNAEVGDKANDGLRVDGAQLRCRVVGEGGNLGFTQRGRIEYALKGGRINTDAIDNSGGVDSSDREVNIKILLNRAVDEGDLTLKQRDRLLAEMTDEVASLVLTGNYQQTQALSLAEGRAGALLDEHMGLIRRLEREGLLDREIEWLPSDEAAAERAAAQRGLTRPELAVLMAYAKITAYDRLLEDPAAAADFAEGALLGYFPTALQQRFGEAIRQHRLRREITATVLTNQIINRMGMSFFFRLGRQSGATVGEVVRAYLAAETLFQLPRWWAEVDALDNQVPAQTQTELLWELAELQERATLWLIRNLPRPLEVEHAVQQAAPALTRFWEQLDQVLPPATAAELEAHIQRLLPLGVPPELARRIAARDHFYSSLDIAKICSHAQAELSTMAGIYFLIAERLDLGWLKATIVDFPSADPWQERLRAGLEEEVYLQLRQLCAEIFAATAGEAPAEQRVESWIGQHGVQVERLRQALAELRALPHLDAAMLAVAVQELKQLVQSATARPLEERRGKGR